MTQGKKVITWLLALLLCLGLTLPFPVSAVDLYFTSINDNLLPLTADTMPVWSGGLLYVPYTVFDGSYTGISFGIYSSYNRNHNVVTLYNLNQILTFDLRNNTCKDEITGANYTTHAITRNGRPYLPVNLVCNFFNLSNSTIPMAQGDLVRIKSDAVVLSDTKFIDAASDLINRRLREYNQSLNPTADNHTPTSPVTPPALPDNNDVTSANVRTYLAFRCQDGEGVDKILDHLADGGVYALFLLTPQVLETEGDLVRRILGTGHSVGLLAEGETPDQTRALLTQGNRLLKQIAHTRTTVVCVPKEQRSLLKAEGWVCWNEVLTLSPSLTVGANTFASTVTRRLNGQTKRAYLTLDGNANSARLLPALLRQLGDKHFVVSIPMETRL